MCINQCIIMKIKKEKEEMVKDKEGFKNMAWGDYRGKAPHTQHTHIHIYIIHISNDDDDDDLPL